MEGQRRTPPREPRTMRLTVYLPSDLHKALMHRCVDEEISATKLTERLIREYLARPLELKGSR